MKVIYDNIEFDSNEEIEFYCWCKELKKEEVIDYFNYHPKSFVLSEKKVYNTCDKNGKHKERHLLHPHEYTPDFEIILKPFTWQDDIKYFIDKAEFKIDILQYTMFQFPSIMIDVKGSFNKYGGDREFSINQKWVHDKHGIYVNKVVTKDLFKKTFVPTEVAFGKRGQLFSRFQGCKIGF